MSNSDHSAVLRRAEQQLQSGRSREAYATARQLISRHPEDIALLIFMSRVTLSLQQVDVAVTHALKAVKLDPDRAASRLCLAECHAVANQWKKAEKSLDKAAMLAKNDFQVLDSVAALYSLCNMYKKAQQTILRAMELAPDSAKLVYNLAIQQRFLGETDDAEQSLNRVVELDPDNSEAIFILSGLRRQTEQSNHISLIKSRLDLPGNSINAKVRLNFALAKEYEDIGQWEKSFEALSLGAGTKRQSFKYNSRQNVKILERTAELQSKEYLSSPVKSCAFDAPIFILGLPRTGSTLVDTMISSHGDVVSAGELPDFPRQFAARIARAAHDHPALGRDRMALSLNIDFRALGRGYRDAVVGKIGPCKHFTDKLPFNFQYCGMIRRALPNARIIHIRRDPMDSCYSIYKALFLSPYPYSYDLEELAAYFVAYYRLMDHWRTAMPGVILDVDYEDIIQDHEKEIRRIIDWCGLPWDPACLNYRKTRKAITTLSAPQVRSEIYSSSVGKWRHFEQQMAPARKYLEQANIPFHLPEQSLDIPSH